MHIGSRPKLSRVAVGMLALLVAVQVLPPFFGLDSPFGLVRGLQTQNDPTACEAVGNNWTSCDNAFASDDVYAYANRTATQFARPDSTVSNGGFTAGGAPTHHEAIDEATPNGDTDYDEADSTDTTLEVSLSGVTDPEISTGHIMRFTANASGSGGAERLDWELREGATLIVLLNNLAISRGSYATETRTLNGTYTAQLTIRIQQRP